MNTYVGVKLIKAKPMTFGEYRALRGWDVPEGKDPNEMGYMVEYQPDGYQSWSPVEVFEKAYFKLEKSDSITQLDVDEFSGGMLAQQLDEKTVHVRCETPTGFVLHETSSCVDPANFDMEIGAKCAGDKIKDKVWSHLGFVLQWARFGLWQ